MARSLTTEYFIDKPPAARMRAAGLFRVSDFRQPRAFVCARVSSFCVSGCTVFRKRWVFRSARRGLIPCFLLAACPFLLFARIRGALCFADGRLFPRSASDVVRSPRRGRGNAAPSHPSLCGTFFPEGAGRIWNRPRATAEHGHGALCFCKGENAGTALRIFARERTRALCAAFVHTHGERICARARHSALMQSGKADVVRRARVREQGRLVEVVVLRVAAPQRLFEPEQVAAALGGLA